jgi:hypothetical protein
MKAELILTTGSYGCRSQNTAVIGGELLNMNCTRMIMENGWKIPENYPIKFYKKAPI